MTGNVSSEDSVVKVMNLMLFAIYSFSSLYVVIILNILQVIDPNSSMMSTVSYLYRSVRDSLFSICG